MLILVDHPVPDLAVAEVGDSNVLYRPELASADEHFLGRELASIAPDALLTRRALGTTAARSWRAACSHRHLVVVTVGQHDTVTFDGPAAAGILSRVVTPNAGSLIKALAAAENAWTEAVVTASRPAGRPRARTASRRSVALVGAGVVNLVTALRLVQEGYEVTIFDRAPDPRADAAWTDYGCSRGGGDARMFTRTEADGYYFGADRGAPDVRIPIRDHGWRVTGPAPLSELDLEWVAENAAVPRWLSRCYTDDILLFNHAAGELWPKLMRDEPAAFDNIGLRNGILRLYTDEEHLHRQVTRQEQVGADPQVLTPDEVAARHPALGDAVRGEVVAGGIQVSGFTVQAHAFIARLVGLLDRSGARLCWGREVSQLRRDGNGAPSGLWVAGELVTADHFVLSTGAYGGELLDGTASHRLIHGVLGAWVTLPGSDRGLQHSLKIARRGHRADDSNVTVANGPDGQPQLIIGSGYGWTGHDPSNIDTEELDVLYAAVEDTAATFFPGPFADARRSGLLQRSRRFCVRPWTASSLGVLEIAEKSDGGVMVVTGGHNTGGFAQAPVVAEAVSAALQGSRHLMHTRYHPDRLRAFLRARQPEARDVEERSLQCR